MTKLSTFRKMTILARVVSQSAGRNRTVSAVLKGVRTSAAHFGRVLHQLWLEVTGFVFLVLAGIGSLALFREYTQYQGGKANPRRMVAAICFTVMFAWFGVSSFWKTRKKDKALNQKLP